MDILAEIKTVMDADADYKTLDANAVADKLNEKVYPGAIRSAALFECLVNRGWYADIALLAEDVNVPKDQRKAAITVLALLADRDREINYANAESGERIISTMDALIAAGALDEETKNIILGLGQNLRTRGEVIGLGIVSGRDVHMARGIA